MDPETRLKNFQSYGMKGWMSEKKLTSLSLSAATFFTLNVERFCMFSGDASWADLLMEVPVAAILRVEDYGSRGLKVTAISSALSFLCTCAHCCYVVISASSAGRYEEENIATLPSGC